MPEAVYDPAYYADLREGARRSAERVLPLVFDRLRPRSVVDFGCGSGGWLAEAGALGADILGVDGSWVPRDTLEIDARRFVAADLSEPVDLGRGFDLALCLEVAEHLPAAAAGTLVGTLTRHAPAVLFSAAIPGQGGTEHVNEAWPGVWSDHFAQAGFDCLDVVRDEIWAEPRIEPWYRQNLLLFVRRDSALARRAGEAAAPPLSLVHPDIWTARLEVVRDLEARLDGAEAEITRLGHAWQALADENADLLATVQKLEGALAAKEAALGQLLASRSWRLTAPLRRLDRLLRGRST